MQPSPSGLAACLRTKALAIGLCLCSIILGLKLLSEFRHEREWARVSECSLRGWSGLMMPHYRRLYLHYKDNPYFLYNYAVEQFYAGRMLVRGGLRRNAGNIGHPTIWNCCPVIYVGSWNVMVMHFSITVGLPSCVLCVLLHWKGCTMSTEREVTTFGRTPFPPLSGQRRLRSFHPKSYGLRRR